LGTTHGNWHDVPKQISYGKVSFAIPYMYDYLNDHKAELETEL